MRRRFALLATLVFAVAIVALPSTASAQAGEQVTSFNAAYTIEQSGVVHAVETIKYDFGNNERHGIFRYTPTRYAYNDKQDRKIDVTDVRVTDQAEIAQPFEITDTDPNIVIKIGNPDVTLTGVHTYVISYTLNGSLNPFTDHDEFFWNVTGNEWEVPITAASATVTLAASATNPIQKVDCFQGEVGSKAGCQTSTFSGGTATFKSRGILFAGSGMTLVVGLNKGAVSVGAPVLVNQIKQKKFADYFVINPISVGLMVAGIVLAIVAVARLWWVQGRDRWLGDMFYLNESTPPATPDSASAPAKESIKPLMAHESIVVEFEPPPVDAETKRKLRPAEIGVLLDEMADTLDVSATIVDLAVRKHLIIKEEASGGVFGMFKHKDYELDKLEPETSDLLPYEQQLKDAFFEDGDTVKLSDLKNKFHDNLTEVKSSLIKQTMSDRFFPYNPETVRNVARGAGIVIALIGGGIIFGLGWLVGGGLVGIPIVVAGVLLFLFAGAFPRRTATGRILYRRSLGFRRFMVESDKERMKFAEKANIFHEYLPYAIVYGCVELWAQRFKDLGIEVGQPGYYVGTGPFIASSFISNVSSFSSSIGSTMASTPGGSGGSGFGGGGGSGGGGGGGGGGSW